MSSHISTKDNNIVFNGMNINDINNIDAAVVNYYSTPSNVVSSQPPPDYNCIIKHEQKFEKQRQQLTRSLLGLRKEQNRDRKAHKYDCNKENNKPKRRSPVPITRRKTRGPQSAASAHISRDITCLNDIHYVSNSAETVEWWEKSNCSLLQFTWGIFNEIYQNKSGTMYTNVLIFYIFYYIFLCLHLKHIHNTYRSFKFNKMQLQQHKKEHVCTYLQNKT